MAKPGKIECLKPETLLQRFEILLAAGALSMI